MLILIVTVNCVTLSSLVFFVIVLQMSPIIATEYKDSYDNYLSNDGC